MRPDEIQEIGIALYGERWQAPLANALGMSDRTIRRMLSGKVPINEGVERDVTMLLMTRAAELNRLTTSFATPDPQDSGRNRCSSDDRP